MTREPEKRSINTIFYNFLKSIKTKPRLINLFFLFCFLGSVSFSRAQSQDIDITQIIAPAACLSNPGNYSVTVQLTNNGATNLNGLPVTLEFSIDGGANFSFPEVFLPTTLNTTGNTENFTFSQPAALTGAQTYNILVRINPSIPGDNDLVDQLSTSVKVMTNFTTSGNSSCVFTDVGFFDASAGAISWNWDFGDGNSSTSQSPVHSYSDTGTYVVTLTSTDGICTGSLSQTVVIRPPVASFVVNPSTGCAIPHTVFFTDQSTLPDTWFWDFGDGNTSTLQNPVHNYTSVGTFTVTLTVTDTIFGCSHSTQQTVTVSQISADFTYVGATFGGPFGCGPLTVDFLDASNIAGAGTITGWAWNFGDGNTSTAQNPTHTYSQPGVYSVTLTTTTSDGCTDTEVKSNYVQVSGPDVDFSPSVTSGCSPLTVTFVDNTLHANPPTNYLWDFGDGNTSPTFGDVTHTFTTSDTFDVSLTVTDLIGCTATESFNNLISTLDNTPPVINCISNQTEYLDASCQVTLPDYRGLHSPTDNCGIDSLQQSPAPGTVITANTVVTITAVDLSSNMTSCNFSVIVSDTIKPTIACPGDVTTTSNPGLCGAVVVYIMPSGLDNCMIANTTQTSGLPSGSLFPVGVTTNTFVATDTAGNVDSCSFTITVTDTEPPTISCPSDISQNNDAGQCGAIINYNPPVGLDNCPGATTVQTAGLPSGSLFPVGTTTNTFEVTDGAGNSATCSFDVVITDTELPTIICPADIAQNNDAGQCGAVVNFLDPVGNDNCPLSTGSTVQIGGLASGSLFPVGTTTNTFEVTDGSGNTATCSFDIVITDTESPTISCPADIAQSNDAGQCGAVVTYTAPTGTDNCPGSTTVQTAGLSSGSLFPVGTTTNTFEVTDAAGNSTTCSFDVVITDTESPTISCPADIAQNNDAGQCGAVVTYTAPTGTDNCPGSTTVQTAGLSSGSLFPVGTTTNTFEVTDAAGNSTTCSFDVVISDTESPTISCPADIAQNNDAGQCGAVINFNPPVGLDNCPGATTVQIAGLPDGSLFPVGTTTNTFEVTDAAGNSTTCSFDVVITDTESPTISCPTDISQNNDAGQCGAIINFNPPVGLDNCPGATTVQTAGLSSGSLFPVGATTNTFEVTDAAGNSTTCSFDVVIADTESPTISCPADIAQNNDAGQCDAVVTYTAPVGTDNCPGSTTVQTAGLSSGSLFPVGTTTNTFEVTDAAGNSTTCSFDVVITDAESPVISCPADIAQNNDAGQCGAVVTYTAPAGTDNCPGSTTVQTAGLSSSSLFPVGTTTNTFEVTDAAGNSTTCSFDVVITDTESPVISCPSDIAQNNDAGQCGAVITYTAPVGTDNCPGSTTVQTAGLSSGSLFPVGTTTNTFEVTDAAGNSTTCSFDVVITDTESPVISCPADITQNNDVGQCGAVVNYAAPVGTDNCPGSTTVQIAGLPDGSLFPVGTTTNTFEVTDAAGNSTTCSFDVIISDTESPAIFCPTNISQNNDVGQCGAVVTYTAPVGTDNCPGSTTVQTAGLPDGSLFPVGTTTNTFEVTDAAGNSTTCSFDVVIADTESPDITCPANIAQDNDAGQCGAVVTYTAPVGTDNCPGANTVQTAGLSSGSLFPVGTTTNTFEVTDAAGNITTCSFDVVISDTEFPVITCPADIAQDNDLSECGATVIYTAPTGTDNCIGATTVQTAGLASGSLFPVGTTTNTFEVTDGAGNSTTCSFDVVITDAEKPEIACPADITQDSDAGLCGAVVAYGVPVGVDNCTGPVTSQLAGLGTNVEYPIGTTTNTFEVVDMAGNDSTCSFDVTIIDVELPTITCTDNIESCDSVLVVEDPVIADNCPNPTFDLTSGLPSESIFPVGVTVNEYTVTDASGNEATCQVEITRFALPTIDAGADIEVDAGKSIIIDAVSTNVNFFEWEPSEGLDMTSIEDPEASPLYSTLYTVTVVSDDGCEATDDVNVNVNLVIEPNNFMSPNGDGKNDTWIIKGHYLLDDCTIKIYTSWGNLVHESTGYNNDWDGTHNGKDLPEGNYYYVISCESDDPVTGAITLIR